MYSFFIHSKTNHHIFFVRWFSCSLLCCFVCTSCFTVNQRAAQTLTLHNRIAKFVFYFHIIEMDTSNFDVLFSTRLGGAALFGSSMTVLLQPQPDPGSSSGGSIMDMGRQYPAPDTLESWRAITLAATLATILV